MERKRDVSRSKLAADAEANAPLRSGTAILVLVGVKVDLLPVHAHRARWSPWNESQPVNLIEIDGKLNGFSIARDLVVRLERVTRCTILNAVTRPRIFVKPLLLRRSFPSNKISIIQVLLVNQDVWAASTRS